MFCVSGGYRGFYSKNTITLTTKVEDYIHKRGGTIIGTSRGGHDKPKIVNSIKDRGINQVYVIGGDATQKGAPVIYQEIRRRGLKAVVAGISKTIDNDIPVLAFL
ncbi:ATP-dependent 6-phosphofructokinase 3-like [Rutidosis leptorrhynchoides]|uniref:ATP-dependent 6-phosphofructokinase 3-like n=1 Tax=Rutidosis leptorrhynchoides TaxID=125765 RepID=UPI003A992648